MNASCIFWLCDNAVFDIDTLGTFTMSKAAFQGLKACGSGCIINISMTLHYGASWYQTHASAAKVIVPFHSAHSSWTHTWLCVISTSVLWHHGAEWYPWTLLSTFAVCCCALPMPCSVGCALQMPCIPKLFDQSGIWTRAWFSERLLQFVLDTHMLRSDWRDKTCPACT